jgi:chaperonin GroEL
MFQVNKPKSASKVMLPPNDRLQSEVLETLSHIAQMVGATLGPGGRQVLIERPEMGMKPIMTKDGVTVIKHLGYESATRQLILEAARDAAVRTASEAGDGTTTATILSDSIAKSTAEAVKGNSRISPQRIVREMQALFPFIEKRLKSYSIQPTENDFEETLRQVATLSANADAELAEKVIEAFNTVGDEGNLTIVECQGPSRYEVERISGYTIDRGLEESCRNFANGFINDKSGTQVILDNPIFLLYDGVINDLSQILDALQKVGDHFQNASRVDRGVVLVAHGFSDTIIGDLHVNWNHPGSKVKVFPLMSPQTAIMNWRTEFLYDLQAYTGSPVFNPIDRPIIDIDPEAICKSNRVKTFESGRFRSSVVCEEDASMIELRVDELKEQLLKPESQYEANDLQVRIGKLTSGIARLNIYGPSQGETRETVKHGAVPGGGYALVRLAADLTVAASNEVKVSTKLAMEILSDALVKPVRVLYANYGYNDEEISTQIRELLRRDDETFDLSEQAWVQKHKLLDSVPAVLEAVRNSISIASLLGTIGGIVAFKRDNDSDKEEERFARRFERTINQE